ncbi:MAG: zinc ribbon domain-containing protein [Thermoproteota archaeon]
MLGFFREEKQMPHKNAVAYGTASCIMGIMILFASIFLFSQYISKTANQYLAITVIIMLTASSLVILSGAYLRHLGKTWPVTVPIKTAGGTSPKKQFQKTPSLQNVTYHETVSKSQEATKICPKCGTANDAKYKFCFRCGTILFEIPMETLPSTEIEVEEFVFCQVCGKKLAKNSKYCSSCGAPLSGAETLPPPPPPPDIEKRLEELEEKIRSLEESLKKITESKSFENKNETSIFE